jgi:CRP/FNR family transcriptional regulator
LTDKVGPHQIITCCHCSFKKLCDILNIPSNSKNLFESSGLKQDDISVSKGQSLYISGKGFKYIYAVKHGTLKTVLSNDRIVDFHFQGDFLGLDGFETNKHQLEAIAIEDTLVCAFDFKDFLAQADSRELGSQFLSQLFSKQANAKMKNHMYPRDALQRICHLLLRLSQRNKEYGYAEDTISLPMKRKDLANYLELTLETVSRSLLALKNAGILLIDNKQITVLDLKKLAEKSNLDN